MGNSSLLKFQQVMENIKKRVALIKHFIRPEMASLGAVSLQSLSLSRCHFNRNGRR